MGMFDSIRCDWPLPDGTDAIDMQSKSLSNTLATYVIAFDGRLLYADGRETGWHGVLRFYGGESGSPLREYEAKFSDGRLVHLLPAADARYDEDGFALAPGTMP